MDKEHELVLRARWWSYRRQRLGQAAAGMEEALHDAVGVYSSHPSAPLSLWARTASFTPDAFRRLEQEKRAFRIPAMRGSIYLMRSDDAAIVFTATSIPHERNMSQMRYTAQYNASEPLSIEEYLRIKEKILVVATDPLTPNQLGKRLDEDVKDIAMFTRTIAYGGEMLRVGSDSLRSNSLRYVSTSAWGANLRDGRDRSEALQVLAHRYLSAFGPARVKDFQWWAGTNFAQAAAAFAPLNTVMLDDGSYLLADDLDQFEQVKPLQDDVIDIVPTWDSYTMGYAPDGRARFISPQVVTRAYASLKDSGGGDALGMVLRAGKAVASWKSSFTGNCLDVKLDLFDQSALPYMQAIQARFDEIATILDGTTCSITVLDPAGPSLVSYVLQGRRKKFQEQ